MQEAENFAVKAYHHTFRNYIETTGKETSTEPVQKPKHKMEVLIEHHSRAHENISKLLTGKKHAPISSFSP